MAGNIKGIIVEIGGDTSALQKSLNKVNSSTASLSKELRGVNSLLKLDPKNTELVSQKQTILKQSIEQTSKKLEELRKAQELADKTIANGGEISQENYRNLQREIISTENKLKQLKAEASKWTNAGRSIEEFGNKVSNISSKIDKMGTALTTKLTLPIVGLATSAIASMDEVDEGLDTIATKTGATGAAAKELQEIYKQVASEVPGEFGDIGAAIGEINTRLDFTGDKLKTASVEFLKFAKVNGTDVNTSVQLVTRAMGDAGIKAEDYASLLDMLTVAGQKSGISIDSLTTNLAKYGAPMRALGIDTKNAIAMFAGWEKAGVNTEIAFSGMKKAISNWGAAGKDSTKEFSKTLDEIAKCPDIAKATTKAIKVFGAKAGPDLADAIKGGRFEFQKYVDALDKGAGTLESTYKQIVDEVDDTQLAMQNAKIAMHDTGEIIAKSLGPVLLDLAKKFKSLMEGFDKLSDKEKKQIINMGLMVAAIGPCVKIVGTLGNTIGTGIKTVGMFTQAIGLIGKTSTEAFNTASAGTQSLAKGLTALTSPAGLATIAVSALATGIAYVAYKQSEATKETREFAEEVKKQKEIYEDYNRNIDKTTNANLAQINSVSKLKNELKTLVDENGKVKEGYESRVKFILNQLNEALGTECKLNDNIVQSYKDLQKEIDEIIKKKKAEIILNGEKEKYAKAVETESDAVKKLKESNEKLGMSIDEAKTKLQSLKDEAAINAEGNGTDYWTSKEIKNLENLINGYESAESELKQCTENKKKYVDYYALFIEGKYEEIGKIVTETTKNWTNSSLKEIQSSIVQQQEELNKYKQIYERTGSEVAQQQMEQAKQNLQNLANELVTRTTTIDTLGLDEISAWRTLANNSYEEYKNAISKMAPEMQQKIQEVTGIIINDTTMQTEAGKLATRTIDAMERKERARETGRNIVKGLQEGIQDKYLQTELMNSSSALADNMIRKMNLSAGVQSPSKYTRQTGRFIDEGLILGLKDYENEILKKASGISNGLINKIKPKSNFNFIDTGKFQGALNRQINNQTKNINNDNRNIIFNIKGTNAEEIADEINKIFGSQY